MRSHNAAGASAKQFLVHTEKDTNSVNYCTIAPCGSDLNAVIEIQHIGGNGWLSEMEI